MPDPQPPLIARRLFTDDGFGRKKFASPKITEFVKKVIEFHVMGHGLTLFDELLDNLSTYKVTPDELHLYLHQKTKLASLWGLEDMQFCLTDVANYTRDCIERAHRDKILPWKLTLYTPPQIFYSKATDLNLG